MRNIMVIIAVFAAIILCGCKLSEPTKEEKAQIANMESQITKLESEISAAEKQKQHAEPGLIANLMQARVEVDKLTVSLLRQHVAALKSGARVDIAVPASTPDIELKEALEEELKNADIELHKTRAESSLYRAGFVKDMINLRAETIQLIITSLRYRHLQAKYGLSIPAIPFAWTTKNKTFGQSSTGNSTKEDELQQPKENKEVLVDDPGPFDFRRVRWGMSKDDVRKRERSVGEDVNEGLVYSERIIDKKASLIYLFDDNKLWRAGYTLSEKYSNNNNYVDDYNDIVSALKDKYGKPKTDKTFWSKDLYKGRHQDRGTAYSLGHVTSMATWERGNTEICATISGENYEISVLVFYSSKDLQAQYGKKQKEKQASNL